jgi:hypothetical protein
MTLKPIFVALLISTAASTARADVSCTPIIHACEQALDDKNIAIEKLGIVNLELEKAYNASLLREHEARNEAGAWYRNPLLMAGLGLLAGFVIAR